MLVLSLLVLANGCFAVWSHRGLSQKIADTRTDLVNLISGKVRAEGPVTAQDQASLRQRLEVRAAERRTAPKPIGL